MRYFVELAYNGANYHGWQRQPHGNSVQQTIEEAFSLVLRSPLEVTGCGRTDTGVHARQYVAHFDYDHGLPPSFLSRINKLLPADIAIYRIFPVAPDAHARFDATQRSYTYYLTFRKDPFRQQTAYHYRRPDRTDPVAMQAAAELLRRYTEFFPFCRSNTDVHTMRCDLRRAEWLATGPDDLEFHISADRFLRGMVRLIVGMCINVGIGKISLEEVRHALDHQTLLARAESAPPEGLFLTEVRY